VITTKPQVDDESSSRARALPRTIKLLAVMEAKTVTGAAKNMLDFCRFARDLSPKDSAAPLVKTSIVTFERGRGREATAASESPNEFVAAARSHGLEVDIIDERTRFDPRVIARLRDVVERRGPDIVLTHHVKSHFVMKRTRLWRRFPWVAFHHGYTKTLRRERLYNQMDRLSLPAAHRVITVCQAFARDLVRAGVAPERISVQHNPISPDGAADAGEARAFRERLGVGSGERLVLAIGRLSSEKAHIDLLRAFGHLRETGPEFGARLVIVGDGPERERLQAAAQSLGILPLTHFTGQMSDVRPCYAAADVLALPSHSEGSPYVLLEAMAARLPVVATRVGGVPEMVEDEVSALLVPARDPRAMAAALTRVLTNPELAQSLAANASALARTRYSPETYVRSLVEIYRGVMRAAPGRES